MNSVKCPQCKARPWLLKGAPCPKCKGSGKVPASEPIPEEDAAFTFIKMGTADYVEAIQKVVLASGLETIEEDVNASVQSLFQYYASVQKKKRFTADHAVELVKRVFVTHHLPDTQQVGLEFLTAPNNLVLAFKMTSWDWEALRKCEIVTVIPSASMKEELISNYTGLALPTTVNKPLLGHPMIATLAANLLNGVYGGEIPHTLYKQLNIACNCTVCHPPSSPWSNLAEAYSVVWSQPLVLAEHAPGWVIGGDTIVSGLVQAVPGLKDARAKCPVCSRDESAEAIPADSDYILKEPVVYQTGGYSTITIPAPSDKCPCSACQEIMAPTGRPVMDLVVHLNDTHRWSRNEIADWLETLDADLSFVSPEEREEVNAQP